MGNTWILCFSDGGDVAFVRHLTVRINTDGRNAAIWARNRRSDDYEIMCKDGSRKAIDQYASCNLGWVPSNVVVTGSKIYYSHVLLLITY